MPELFSQVLDLKEKDVFLETEINDTRYFSISGLPSTLSYGKHPFSITFNDPEGQPLLKNLSNIVFEFVDSRGTVIFSDLVDISELSGAGNGFVWIKKDPLRTSAEIADGPAFFYVMGELDGKEIPQDWKGIYNVRSTFEYDIRKDYPNTSNLVLKNPLSIQTNFSISESIEFDSADSVFKRSFINISLTDLETNGGKIESVELAYNEQKASTDDFEIITTYPLDSGSFETDSQTLTSGLNPITNTTKIPTPKNFRRLTSARFRLRFLNPAKQLAQYLDENRQGEIVEVTSSFVEFQGSPLFIESTDNLLKGRMFTGNKASSGFIQSGESSALLATVDYEGFLSASKHQGSPGIAFFSGSVYTASGETYDGVGLELVGNSESFFRFRSNPSILDVRAQSFFVGSDTSQFISGSGGNIEISSSLFHLNPATNTLSISGSITAISGSIGGFQIQTDRLVNNENTVELSSTTPGLNIKDAGGTERVSIKSGSFLTIGEGTQYIGNRSFEDDSVSPGRNFVNSITSWSFTENGGTNISLTNRSAFPDDDKAVSGDVTLDVFVQSGSNNYSASNAYEISQIITSSFNSGDTFSFSGVARFSSSFGGIQKDRALSPQYFRVEYSSSNSNGFKPFLPQANFTASNGYGEYSLGTGQYNSFGASAELPESAAFLKVVLSGSINDDGGYSIERPLFAERKKNKDFGDKKFTKQIKGSPTPEYPQTEITFDNFSLRSNTRKVELTDQGLLIYNSEDSFIKMDSTGIEFRGGSGVTSMGSMVTRESFTNDSDVAGRLGAPVIQGYEADPEDIGVTSFDGNVSQYAKGNHRHKITFSTINNVVSSSVLNVGGIISTGDITAENYIVKSTITQMTQSFSSGSTIFGDTLDDTHQFTGSIKITGSIEGITIVSSSGQLASDISGSFVAPSASFSTRLTTAESELSNTLVSSSAQLSSDISGSFSKVHLSSKAPNIVSSSAQIAADISGSLGKNAADIRALSALSVSGSFGESSASFSTRITNFETDTLISSSIQIASAISGSWQNSLSSSDMTFINGGVSSSAFGTGSFGLLLQNGNPIVGASVGGSNTQVQFNDGGNFGGDSKFTFNKTTGLVTATSFTGIFKGALSSSAQIASDISGSFVAPSASISTRLTAAESELGNTLISSSAQIASDISGSFSKSHLTSKVPNVVTSSAQIASDISGSLGPNATLIRGLTATNISGSFTAPSASISTRLTTAESELSNTLVSSSAQLASDISGSFGATSASISTRLTTEEGNVDTLQARDLIAGNGLTGGGDLTSDRTFNVGEGTGISVSSDAIATNDSEIVHDNLSGFVADEHIDHSSVSITAGTGLTGGGTIASTRTLAIDFTDSTFKSAISGSFGGQRVGTSDSPVFAGLRVVGDISAERYIVSSSITKLTQSFSSGSTIFGDDITDTHKFTGSLFISGALSITDDTLVTNLNADKLDGQTGTHYLDFGNFAIDDNEIPIAKLAQDAVTVTAGDGLKNGGSVTLGSSVTLDVDVSDFAGTGLKDEGSENLGIDFTDSTFQSNISGSFTSVSSSFSSRITTAENELGNTLISSSAQIASDISGSSTALSSSVAGRLTTNETKLSGIEDNATADQTAADIRGLGFFDTSNDGASSGLDADLLDGQHGSHYLDFGNFVIDDDEIPIAKLAQDAVTVTAGDGLKTGGSVTLGSSVTLDIDVSDFAGTGLRDEGSENLGIDFTDSTFQSNISGSFVAPSASISTRLTTEEGNVDTLQARNLTAGDGLTGGGDLTSDRTFAVGAGTGVTVNANDVAIGQDVATTSKPLFAAISSSGDISGSSTSTGSFGHGFIDNKLGIGEKSPDELLHIKSSTASNPVIKLENAGDVTNGAQIHFVMSTTGEGDNDIPGTIRFKGMNSSNAETEFSTIYTRNIDVTDTEEDSEMHFRTMAAGTLDSHMMIKSDKVGIGTTSPEQLLHLRSEAPFLAFTDSSNNSESGVLYRNTSGTNVGYAIYDFGNNELKFRTNNNLALTIDSSGNAEFHRGNISGSSTSTGSFGKLALDSGTITTTGDITLDSGGDIILDADGTDIILKDGGTSFGSFKRVSSDFVIKSEAQDKDIVFKGNDGGGTITAMTIDMSEGGNVGIGTTSPDQKLHVVGNAFIDGTLTAREFFTDIVSSSIQFTSGSTKFGDTLDDKHMFTGSIEATGSMELVGRITPTEIGAFTAKGAINFDNQNMTNVDIDTGDIASDVTINKSPTITLGGDLGGSLTLTNLAGGTLNATIQADSVALGTDTTGNYMVGVSGTTNEIEVSHTPGEGSSATIGLPDDVTIGSDLTVGDNITFGDTNQISTTTFISGITGDGFRVIDGGSDGVSMEIDNILVRNTLRTHIFQKDVVKATNGVLFISDSGVISGSTDNLDETGTVTFENDKSATFSSGDRLLYKDIDDASGAIKSVSFRITASGVSAGTGFLVYGVDSISGSMSDLTGSIGGTAVKISGGTLTLDASSADSPYMDVNASSGSAVVRMGNLAGITSPTFGALGSEFGLWASGSAYLEGTINATSGGFIAGWELDSNTIEKVDDNGGVRIDSSNKRIDFLQDASTTRLRVGQVDSNKFGIRGFDNNADRVFEISETRNEIAGWTISPGNIEFDDSDGSIALSAASQSLQIFTGSIDFKRPNVVVGKLPVNDGTTNKPYGFAVFSGSQGEITSGSLDNASIIITKNIAKLAGWELVPGRLRSGTVADINGNQAKIALGAGADGTYTTAQPNLFYVSASSNPTFFVGENFSFIDNVLTAAGWKIGKGQISSSNGQAILSGSGVLSLGSGTHAYESANRTYIDGPGNRMSIGEHFSYTGGVLSVGGWKIGNNIISSSVSADTDGIIIDSEAKSITFHGTDGKDSFSPGTAVRNNVRFAVGKVDSGAFGMRAYDASGNAILSITDAPEALIAGWTIGTDTIANGTDIVIDKTNKRIALNDNAMAFGFGVGGTGKHGLHIDATNHIYSTGEFIFGTTGSNGQFISASNGNIEISSSAFHLDNTGNVTLSGSVTAGSGTIGGFSIDDHSLTTTGVEINDSTQTLFISSSNFKVKHDGEITGSQVLFSGGTIGGFDIDTDGLSSTNNSFQVTGSTGQITGSNVLFDGGKVGGFTISSTQLSGGSSGTTIALTPGTGIHMGAASFGSAPFSVTNAGVLKAASGNVGGFTIDGSHIKSSAGDNFELDNQGGSAAAILRMGSSASSQTRTSGTGVFMDGNGHFRVGEGNGHRIEFDGTSLIMSASKFFLGGSSQFISGSNSNLEISSSGFHLDRSGNVTLSGSITAISGDIGGFSIGDDLSATSGILTLKGASGQITASKARLTGGQISQFVFDEETMRVGSQATSSMVIQHSGGGKLNLSGNDGRGFTLGTHLDFINFPNRTVPIAMVNADEASGEQTYFFVGSGSNFIEFDNRPDAGVSNFQVSTKTFFLGSDDQFVSGSNGNIEISSSGFHLDKDGNAALSGSITAISGDIGGFTLDNGDLIFKNKIGNVQATASIEAQTYSSGLTQGFLIESRGTDPSEKGRNRNEIRGAGAKQFHSWEYRDDPEATLSNSGRIRTRVDSGYNAADGQQGIKWEYSHDPTNNFNESLEILMKSGSANNEKDNGITIKYKGYPRGGTIGDKEETLRIGKLKDGPDDKLDQIRFYGISGSSQTTASFGTYFGDGSNLTGVGGTGDVSVSGTPADNQLAVWTAADTIEGDSNLTWDGTDLKINTDGQIVFQGTNGGNNQGIQYYDSGGTNRYGLIFPGSDIVALVNRASNGVVQIRANRATVGSPGELVVAEFQDDKIIPGTDNAFDLGASDKRWSNIYSADLQLSNEGTEGNEVDGTTGSWTIQEGEDDLYLLNRKNGKKYRFKLEEVE